MQGYSVVIVQSMKMLRLQKKRHHLMLPLNLIYVVDFLR